MTTNGRKRADDDITVYLGKYHKNEGWNLDRGVQSFTVRNITLFPYKNFFGCINPCKKSYLLKFYNYTSWFKLQPANLLHFSAAENDFAPQLQQGQPNKRSSNHFI